MIHRATAILASASLFLSIPCTMFLLLSLTGCGEGESESVSGTSVDSPTSDAEVDNGDASDSRQDDTNSADASTRRFRFFYDVSITGVEPGKEVDVWVPIASNNPHQEIEIARIDVPTEYASETSRDHDNRMISFTAEANEEGEIPILVEYVVSRKEVTSQNYLSANDQEQALALLENALVPLGGTPQELFLTDQRDSETNIETAQWLYDIVLNHVDYDKPEGGQWGRGDAVWVCDSKHGNCTDFHSLFMSLCRTSSIPARFEIGFPIPDESGEVGGYHCWASFVVDDKWVPVDISEADKDPTRSEYLFGNLSNDRVLFTIGRDLELAPKQQSGPLNYFIYPHAEIDGVPHTSIEKRFRCEIID